VVVVASLVGVGCYGFIQQVSPTDRLRRPLASAFYITDAGVAAALAKACFRSYINGVLITYDKAKREVTLSERGLDFADAKHVFAGPTFETVDQRRDYGEKRIVCFGLLDDRLVVVGYTPRGADRHVFSMRKANDREQARIGPILRL
jgi:uncharacterized protein